MPYSSTFPSSAVLANAAAQALDYVAPPVVAGTPPHRVNIDRSRKELNTRKRLRDLNLGAVSDNTISRSEIRHHALLHEHASALVPAGVLAPPWFGPAISPLTVQVNGITERLKNQQAHRRNRRACLATANNVEGNATTISQVFKTNAGFGAGLPGQPLIAVPVPVPAVGALPGPLFPVNIGRLHALTALQLHQLSCFYNDAFGIVAGDPLNVQVDKFKAFICGD